MQGPAKDTKRTISEDLEELKSAPPENFEETLIYAIDTDDPIFIRILKLLNESYLTPTAKMVVLQNVLTHAIAQDKFFMVKQIVKFYKTLPGADILDFLEKLTESIKNQLESEETSRLRKLIILYFLAELEFAYHAANANKSPDKNYQYLNVAVELGNLAVVKQLIEENPDFVELQPRGETIIFCAVGHGQLEIVRYLVEEADANVHTTMKGESGDIGLLHHIVENHQLEKRDDLLPMWQYLVGVAGVDPSIKNSKGRDALAFARSKNWVSATRWAISAPSVSLPKKETKQEVVQLLKAAKDGNLEQVEKLIEDGTVDVNTQNQFGWTALHFATAYERNGMVGFLLANDANVNLRTKDAENIGTPSGTTALTLAIKRSLNRGLIQVLATAAKASAAAQKTATATAPMPTAEQPAKASSETKATKKKKRAKKSKDNPDNSDKPKIRSKEKEPGEYPYPKPSNPEIRTPIKEEPEDMLGVLAKKTNKYPDGTLLAGTLLDKPIKPKPATVPANPAQNNQTTVNGRKKPEPETFPLYFDPTSILTKFTETEEHANQREMDLVKQRFSQDGSNSNDSNDDDSTSLSRFSTSSSGTEPTSAMSISSGSAMSTSQRINAFGLHSANRTNDATEEKNHLATTKEDFVRIICKSLCDFHHRLGEWALEQNETGKLKTLLADTFTVVQFLEAIIGFNKKIPEHSPVIISTKNATDLRNRAMHSSGKHAEPAELKELIEKITAKTPEILNYFAQQDIKLDEIVTSDTLKKLTDKQKEQDKPVSHKIITFNIPEMASVFPKASQEELLGKDLNTKYSEAKNEEFNVDAILKEPLKNLIALADKSGLVPSLRYSKFTDEDRAALVMQLAYIREIKAEIGVLNDNNSNKTQLVFSKKYNDFLRTCTDARHEVGHLILNNLDQRELQDIVADVRKLLTPATLQPQPPSASFSAMRKVI